jgi:hypothetical protein
MAVAALVKRYRWATQAMAVTLCSRDLVLCHEKSYASSASRTGEEAVFLVLFRVRP